MVTVPRLPDMPYKYEYGVACDVELILDTALYY